MDINGHFGGWTIFRQPDDHYVARLWWLKRERGQSIPTFTDDMMTAHTLEVLRDAMTMRGLTCVPRSDEDTLDIIESWI